MRVPTECRCVNNGDYCEYCEIQLAEQTKRQTQDGKYILSCLITADEEIDKAMTCALTEISGLNHRDSPFWARLVDLSNLIDDLKDAVKETL